MGNFKYFWAGLILSFLISFLWKHEKTKCIVEYKDSVVFIERQIPKNVIPLFIQPRDSDKTNFVKYKDESHFTSLMIRYLYVPVEEEGFLYALLASNQYGIKESEYYIYRYLAERPFSKFTHEFDMSHLKRGAKLGDRQCVSTCNEIEIDENE